jgi:hypothetical protein
MSVVSVAYFIVFDWWQLPKHYHAKNMFDAELNWALGNHRKRLTFWQIKHIVGINRRHSLCCYLLM